MPSSCRARADRRFLAAELFLVAIDPRTGRLVKRRRLRLPAHCGAYREQLDVLQDDVSVDLSGGLGGGFDGGGGGGDSGS